MPPTSPPTTRRHFLRSAGVALGLPFLPSFGWRAFARSPAVAPPSPRFLFVYTPNGYLQSAFVPQSTGPGWELTPSLQPLAAVRSEVTLITGLDRTFVPGTGVHAQCGSCWLTSAPPDQTLDGGFPTHTSLDQILARQIGGDTPLPSLELSCNDFADNKETKYFECISWYGPGHAAGTEKNPRAIFRRLFGQAAAGPTRSVLDAISEEARELRRRLGAADQGKLDEYLESVRATERRIQLAETAHSRVARPPLPEPAGIPEKRGDYLGLMGELVAHAFELDLTRVATLVVDPERWDSPRMFHGVFDRPQNHHVLTHTKGDEAKEKVAAIDRFHVAQFARLIERFQSIRTGSGTLLDSTTLVMGSGISDGDSHNYADLQVLLAGGALPRGHFHYAGRRPLADLWLTLARRAGVARERFADSTGILRELQA